MRAPATQLEEHRWVNSRNRLFLLLNTHFLECGWEKNEDKSGGVDAKQ
jgi:hypothetical protein